MKWLRWWIRFFKISRKWQNRSYKALSEAGTRMKCDLTQERLNKIKNVNLMGVVLTCLHISPSITLIKFTFAG